MDEVRVEQEKEQSFEYGAKGEEEHVAYQFEGGRRDKYDVSSIRGKQI